MRPRLCSEMMALVQGPQSPLMQPVQAKASFNMHSLRQPVQYIWTGLLPPLRPPPPAPDAKTGELSVSIEEGFMIWN
jgi:hypothetical protein